MKYKFERVSKPIDPDKVIIEGHEDGGFGLSLVVDKTEALDLALQIMARLGYSMDKEEAYKIVFEEL